MDGMETNGNIIISMTQIAFIFIPLIKGHGFGKKMCVLIRRFLYQDVCVSIPSCDVNICPKLAHFRNLAYYKARVGNSPRRMSPHR